MSALPQSHIDLTPLEETNGLTSVRASTGNTRAETPQSNPIPEPNRRLNDRRRLLKEGRIVFNDRQSVINCLVRNLSDTGACLEVISPIGIPDFFDLDLGQSGFRSCSIAWRKSRRIGVTFLLPFFKSE